MIIPFKKYFKALQTKQLIQKNDTTIETQSYILKDYTIAVYFSPTPRTIYQLEQWFACFQYLENTYKIVIITRKISTFNWLKKHTHFTIVFCRSLNELIDFYEKNNLKIILYVNHGVENFQSLTHRDAFHIHINHGESEKTSTISNQANAYNYVFIVGDAAYDKYQSNLLKVDMTNFIQIGRPQLEYCEPIPELNHLDKTKKIILYAPTWEGTHESMNYTSLNDYGLSIITQILEHPNTYLLYKPHPNTGSRDTSTQKIHKKLLTLVAKHKKGKLFKTGDINNIYPYIDIAIFDNSAVAIDYLAIDKPMIMTDMFFKLQGKRTQPKIIGATRLLQSNECNNLIKILFEEIKLDTKKVARNTLKTYFLGNYNYLKKESTHTFINELERLMKERDFLLKKRLKEY
jgi:hypothetical protein